MSDEHICSKLLHKLVGLHDTVGSVRPQGDNKAVQYSLSYICSKVQDREMQVYNGRSCGDQDSICTMPLTSKQCMHCTYTVPYGVVLFAYGMLIWCCPTDP
jgi:hypothetical protein